MTDTSIFIILAIIIAIAVGFIIYLRKEKKDKTTLAVLALIAGFILLVSAILLFAPDGDGSSDDGDSIFFPWWIIFWVAIFPILSKNQKPIDSKKKKYLMIVVGLTVLIVIGTIILVL